MPSLSTLYLAISPSSPSLTFFRPFAFSVRNVTITRDLLLYAPGDSDVLKEAERIRRRDTLQDVVLVSNVRS